MFPAEIVVYPCPVILQKHSLLVTTLDYITYIRPCARKKKNTRMQHKGILGAFQIQQKQSNH